MLALYNCVCQFIPMKNIGKCFLRENNSLRVQVVPCFFLCATAKGVEGGKVKEAMVQEGLFGVVPDAPHIPPRDSVHAVQYSVQGLVDVFDNSH